MNDMFFWLGEDGGIELVSEEAFERLQSGSRERTRKWREVDTKPSQAYYFYGVLEPIEEDDEYEANNDWDDLLNYSDGDAD